MLPPESENNPPTTGGETKSLRQVAEEMQAAVIEYYRSNTEEEDARREAERDARVKAVIEKLGREGKLPPPLPEPSSDRVGEGKSIQQVADEVQAAMIRYFQTNTEEEDVRREAERDARVKAALEKLAREGKLPPRMKGVPAHEDRGPWAKTECAPHEPAVSPDDEERTG